MCRLLGYASRVPTTLADLLGEGDLRSFTELSVKHGDGWGVARATDDGVEVLTLTDAAPPIPVVASLTACEGGTVYVSPAESNPG